MTDKVNNKVSTKVYALGGLHEVGKNMYVVEHGDSIIIMDCGVKFGGSLPGVDAIIQDYTHLIENKEKIKALVITHGHEDHIGGIPHLLNAVHVPKIYAPRLATGLIHKKLKEKNVTKYNLIEYKGTEKLFINDLTVSFFANTHSIPDSFGIAIKTPNGTIVNTGDFKFDMTPIGAKSEYAKMAQLGVEGVDLLLSDSTNSEVTVNSISESEVKKEIKGIFRDAENKRLIIATFASNVNRVKHIIDSAIEHERKIAVFGRSMEKVVEMGRKMGHIEASDNTFVKSNKLKHVPDEKLLILCTGSQGEPLAALSRISRDEHAQIKVRKGDVIVFSSSPIPGNAVPISNIINNLIKKDATVIVNSSETTVHASGHASKGEQQLMLALMQPKNFMPVHGDFRMLKIHGETGQEMGIEKEKIFICSNGDVVELLDGVCKQESRVQAGAIYLDQTHKGVSNKVMADRIVLAEDGFVAVMIPIDPVTNTLLRKPQIITRGFVYMKESGALIRKIQNHADWAIRKELSGKTSFGKIKNAVSAALGPMIYKELRRNPIIAPVIMSKIKK